LKGCPGLRTRDGGASAKKPGRRRPGIERERRQQAVDKAQAALEEAEKEHAKRAADLRAELEVIEDRIRSENDDWNEAEKRLKAALRHARD